ncbi:hypothetical protein [Microbacterium sp. zg.Y909]|uniref:hypothetical protein n=1 Tax=Microbacterium sp. zg.Y909 TaxID=2969413 RepID=UPI00214BE7E1|nr:hypothetical protein [Microbacterium sp. zg.Y909]MCR2824642.1 hypothetical protein [Microbacterium sp. zg.Y909]
MISLPRSAHDVHDPDSGGERYGEIAGLHVSTWREAYAHLLPEDHFSAEYIA